MPPRLPLAALACALLLGGCATSVAPPPSTAPGPGAPPAAVRPAPARPAAFDWPAARAGIARALDGAGDVQVSVRDDGALRLLVPGAEAFARGSSEPRPALRATLDRIAAALAAPARTRVLVLGHTDSIGRELYNLELSIHRAEAVSEYLRTRGIALARLTADGRGEAEPLADNATEAGRASNRRVEIIVQAPE